MYGHVPGQNFEVAFLTLGRQWPTIATSRLRQLNVRLLLENSSLFYNLVRLLECQTLRDSNDSELIMKHQPVA